MKINRFAFEWISNADLFVDSLILKLFFYFFSSYQKLFKHFTKFTSKCDCLLSFDISLLIFHKSINVVRLDLCVNHFSFFLFNSLEISHSRCSSLEQSVSYLLLFARNQNEKRKKYKNVSRQYCTLRCYYRSLYSTFSIVSSCRWILLLDLCVSFLSWDTLRLPLHFNFLLVFSIWK